MLIALRWLGYVAVALVLIALLAAAWAWVASSRAIAGGNEAKPETLVRPAALDLAEAERRARTLGCVSCHGEGLTGSPFLKDAKVALLHAPNLTAIAAKATDQHLAQAIRQGIGHDGKALYVMPSEAYQHLTNEETASLIAWIRSLPRKGEASPPRKIGPLGRIGIVTGKFPSSAQLAAQYRQKPAADLGPAHKLGRHLAVTTCAGCHGSDLSGREFAPGQLAPSLDIAGAYDLPAFTRLLREGAAPPGRHIKEMKSVAKNDSRFYTDAEIAALHAYLSERATRAQ